MSTLDVPPTKPVLTIPVMQEVNRERVSDMLVGAFEGGSNYWIHAVTTTRKPPEGAEYEYASDVPMAGGVLTIIESETDENGKRKRHLLDEQRCIAGLAKMAAKYPRHFADLVGEKDDACTADVFLQMCLFDDLVYG